MAAGWAALLLTACTGPAGPPASARSGEVPPGAATVAAEGRPGGVLRFALAGEPDTFNPLAAADSRSRTVAYLTSATLLETTPETNEVVCGLCEDHALEPDAGSLSLTLREGLRFSDGTPVSVDDIRFVFDRIYAPDSHNVLREMLLVEGEPIRVEVAGPRSVRFRFPAPCPSCPYLLAQVPLLPRHLLDGWPGGIESAWTLDTPPARMAGLGPFRIRTHEPGQRTVLEANPYYWRVDQQGIQLPYLDELTLEFVPDRSNRLLRLEAGSLDIVDQLLQPEDWQLVRNGGKARVIDAGPSSTLSFFWFNLGSPPSKKPWVLRKEFRHAVSRVLNRRDMVTHVYRGYASPAYSLLSSAHGMWFVPPSETQGPDTEAALQELRQLGLSLQQSGGSRQLKDPAGQTIGFELLTRTDEAMGRTAALIQQDLAQVGIEVQIRQEEMRAVIARISSTREYEAALMTLDIPLEPSSISNLLLSSGSMHVWNPGQARPATEWERQVDELMRRVLREADPEVRLRNFHQVQQILADELPLIPLVNRNVVVAVSPHVNGVVIANRFPYSLAEVWRIWRHGEGPH
ncbi:MAG: ABC transporter substrate-binding protein [Acidobacteriota bacterium]